MADDSRPKRILADLCSAFRRDPKIDEFDFIYCPEAVVNRSPVVLENHKLGLQTWSIKLLFNYVYDNLMRSGGALKDLKSLHEFSRAALLLNPECYSIWNMRKKLVTRRYIKAEDDLKLATIIQTKHPKSPETFIQRRWLLQQIFPSAQTPPTHANGNSRHCPTHPAPPPSDTAHHQVNGNSTPEAGRLHESLDFELTERHKQVVRGEMEACRAAADRYPSNYNAWSHRVWVLQRIARLDTAILEEELASTEAWVRSHISDHSGFNYRHFLLHALSGASSNPCRDQVISLLQEELSFTARLIQSFPGHEAIWYHRRSVINIAWTYLRVAQHHIRAMNTINNPTFPPDPAGDASPNGYAPPDAELVAQGEGEWLLLKDYSAMGSPPNPKAAKTELSSEDHADGTMRWFTDAPSKCTAKGLALMLQSEGLFTETALKSVCKADRALQERCIGCHERWLRTVQY